jgi:DNA polymerase III alpha subunit
MISDKYGQTILSELDLCNAYMENPDRHIKNCLTEKSIVFSPDLEIDSIPELIDSCLTDYSLTVEQYDSVNLDNWNMPLEYKKLDIAEWVLNQCTTDTERQRVGEELLMFLDRNMFRLLQYLKYLVDIMRANNIVWGVGRGSSVSSYVLYLIGVHKIDSIYYDLDITEFLR